MKKVLLGTTALVAAGVIGAGEAEAKFDMTVGGYYNTAYGFVNEDDDDGESGDERQNQNLGTDGEVHFKFSQTLDNGIMVGGRFELEGFTSSDQIDERHIYFRGGFGELRIGDEDDARKLKSYAAPEASGLFGVNSPFFTFNNLAAAGQVTSSNTTFPNLENDSAKLIYFTPSFGGFQLAVSYAPDATQDVTGFGTLSTQNGLSNAISVGADYSGEFGGVTIGFGGGYSMASGEGGTFGDADPSIWAAGINVGFGGFTVGGSVAFVDADTGVDDESTVFDIGATYTMDAVTVGVDWSRGSYEHEGEDDTLDHVQLTAGYALGEGVNLGAMIGWFNYEDEGPLDNDNTGWQTGVGVGFSL